MEDNPLTIKEQESLAIDNYFNERSEITDVICKKATKQSFHQNMFMGISGGATLGLIIGLLLTNTKAQVPVYDSRGHVIEYKTDYNLVSKYMISSITIVMLAMLAFAGVKTNIDKKINRVWCKKLAHDFITESFKTPLKKLQQPIANDDKSLSRIVSATAFIISNMPEDQLRQIRELAVKAYDNLSEDEYFSGSLDLDNTCVNSAAQLISNYINKNYEVQFNVLRIMNGCKPVTYFLPTMYQKTK